jgi:hypothetical protein
MRLLDTTHDQIRLHGAACEHVCPVCTFIAVATENAMTTVRRANMGMKTRAWLSIYLDVNIYICMEKSCYGNYAGIGNRYSLTCESLSHQSPWWYINSIKLNRRFGTQEHMLLIFRIHLKRISKMWKNSNKICHAYMSMFYILAKSALEK